MERIIQEEKWIIETLEVSEEDILFIDETLQEAKEVKKSLSTEKEVVYFSNSIIILEFIYKDNILQENGSKIEGDEYTILQVYDRDLQKSSFHFCKDERLRKSVLLNLINKGESYGNKKTYL